MFMVDSVINDSIFFGLFSGATNQNLSSSYGHPKSALAFISMVYPFPLVNPLQKQFFMLSGGVGLYSLLISFSLANPKH